MKQMVKDIKRVWNPILIEKLLLYKVDGFKKVDFQMGLIKQGKALYMKNLPNAWLKVH